MAEEKVEKTESQKNIDKYVKVWKVCRIFEALILLTIGVLAIIYRDNSTFKAWIFRIIGILLILDGSIVLIKYFLEPVMASTITQGFILSILEVSFGVLFIVKADNIFVYFEDLIVWFLCILLFATALIFIIAATIGIIRKERKMSVAVIEYIIAAAFITGGVLILIYQDRARQVVMTIVLVVSGLILIGLGMFALVTAFVPDFFKNRAKKAKKIKPVSVKEVKSKEDEDNTVDAESSPIEEEQAEEDSEKEIEVPQLEDKDSDNQEEPKKKKRKFGKKKSK